MLSSKDMDRLAENEMDDIFTGVSLKDKMSKYYEYLPLTGKGQMEIVDDHVWPMAVFLTPPASPDSSHSYEAILDVKQNDSDLFVTGASRTKDLKSMLIRDCMWNGESPKKGRCFDKIRPLTRTPPLVDCNLRVMFVDPCEIWPFNFCEQPKAGKVTTTDIDEEVEVDVVGLDGSLNIEEKSKNNKEEKQVTEDCEAPLDSVPSCEAAQEAKSLRSPENTDHDYTCNLRSTRKRRRSSESDSDKENYTEQKTRILSGDESDPDCEILGRATHNVLERKRRNELKLRFQYLRDSIPDLSGNDRAPKVAILQNAYSYILQLQTEERGLLEQITLQKNRNEELLKRVFEMQNASLSF